MSKRRSCYLHRFNIQRQLGEGSYGIVVLATDLTNNKDVALKIINKGSIKKVSHINRLRREVNLLRLLDHPHIVKLFDVVETSEEIVLVMEYVSGGDLFDYVIENKRLSEDMTRKLFRQLVSALMYCHDNMIVHRDLKPENLLLDENDNLKIIDFGFVRTYLKDPEENLKTYCGSLYYCSPEMLDGTPYSGPSVDIWSMGIILYVFANGYLPFRDTNAADLYQAIRNGDFKDGEYSSTPCNLLIRKMIKPKSMDRPSIQEIAHDLWVNDGYIEVPKYTEAISSALSQFREVISDKLREYEMDHEKYDQMIKGRSLRHLQVFITIDSLMAKDISTTASSAANLSQVSPTPDSGYDGHIQVSVSDVVPSLSDLPHLKHASHDEAHEFTSCPQQSKMDHLEALSEAKEFISGPVPYISPTSMATPSLHTETKMQKFLRRFSRQPAEETKTGGGTKKGFSLFLKT